jgi:hypothetical protein
MDVNAVRTIERDKRLSQSVLWDLQRQFYLNNAIDFWRERASFTSANPVVVSASVDLLFAFLGDCLPFLDARAPIYVIELGTGSGCFAYRFLKQFLPRLRSSAALTKLDIRYVMTDFIPEIVDVWRRNAFLKEFVEDGVLDFAVFDPAHEKEFVTSNFAWNVESSAFLNPPIFIANALFDTIAVDGFRFQNGAIDEVIVSVNADSDDGLSALISNSLSLQQKFKPLTQRPYHDDPDFEFIVKQYSVEIPSGTISIPIEALNILKNLRKSLSPSFALLCCSRGFTGIDYVKNFDELQYNDLSFPLNFDALKKYFGTCGGELLIPDQPLVTRCLSFGYFLEGKTIPVLERTQAQYPLSASRLMDVHTSLDEKESRLASAAVTRSTIDLFVDIVSTGQFDPPLFLKWLTRSLDAIESELPTASNDQCDRLRFVLRQVDANIYTFDSSVPQVEEEEDLFALLIRLWQRANAGHHQSKGISLFLNSID